MCNNNSTFKFRLSVCLSLGRVPVAEGLEEYQDELLAQARLVVNSPEGWWPAFFMIDKARSSKAAIEHGMLYDFQEVTQLDPPFSLSGDHHPYLPVPCHAGFCFLMLLLIVETLRMDYV